MELFFIQFFQNLGHEFCTPVFWARLQFALTAIIHYIFPPLTIGLSLFIAILETAYVRTGKEHYKRMVKFWGRLFLINFAAGVVTGIVMEFQFGMNWSVFSGYVGSVFGVPLAIEILLAFFIESTFLGLWIFGWDKVGKKLHAAFIWLVAIGTSLSAVFIIIANSWMQEPVGFAIKNGRAELTSLGAIMTSGQFYLEFWHTWFAAICTAAFFVIGISAYNLLKKHDSIVFKTSLKFVSIYALIGIIGVAYYGDAMASYIAKHQPMKLAAMESLWESENPAGESLFAIPLYNEQRNVIDVKIPHLLSMLVYKRLDGKILGIKEVQKMYVEQYGPGNYVPPILITYYAFRAMAGVAILMLIIAIYLFIKSGIRNKFKFRKLTLWCLIISIIFPYIANITGWIVTEVGRQPWMVMGLLKTSEGVSNHEMYSVIISLGVLVVVFGIVALVAIYLLWKFAIAGTKDFLPEGYVETEEK